MSEKIKIPLDITVLTPLHVGSGKELVVGQDVLVKDKKAFLLSFDRIVESYYSRNEFRGRIRELMEGRMDLKDILPEKDILKFKRYEAYIKTSRPLRVGDKIKEFIKDAYSKPYIPGTTIKGGIRTLIFQEYVKEHSEVLDGFKSKLEELESVSKKERKRYSKIKREIEDFEREEKVFGRDAKSDPLKSLAIADASFNNGELYIYTSKVFDISNDGEGCGWRRASGGRGSLTKIGDATPTFLEVLKVGSKGYTEISIDKFFLEKLKLSNNFVMDILSDFYGNLSRISVEYAKKKIKEEVDFLKRFLNKCEGLNNVVGFLFKKLIKDIDEDPEAIYIRIGWGIGWKGITGDYMSEDIIEKLLSEGIITQGRRGSKFFPKTRRFVTTIYKGEEHSYAPFGWIKLKKRSKDV